jgi:predicted RND superfamily exporter protein
MSSTERLLGLVTARSKTVIAVFLVLVLVLGAGATNIQESTEMEMFSEEPPEVAAERTVQEQFSATGENTTTLVVAVHNESDSVLSRESLLASLRYQQSLLKNETVARTLIDERPMLGIENLVAATAIRQERQQARQGDSEVGTANASASAPPLSAQIAQLESMSDQQVEQVVGQLLNPENRAQSTALAFELLPKSYEPGSTDASGRITVVRHATDGVVVSLPELSEEVREGQVAAEEIANDVPRDEYRHSGFGLMLVEEELSIGESFSLIGPIALLLVLVTLSIAYRDALDLLLGVVGILLVLVWTFGAMGWLGIDFSLLMIVTPVLLIGLSIDYCIHVLMRYRENRAGNGVGEHEPTVSDTLPTGTAASDGGTARSPIRAAMHDGLVGLGPALVLVTVTAIVGFLSILTTGVPVMSDFAVATAVGLVGALFVFGAFVPALKVELDEWLTGRGYDRANRAFGTTGRLRRVLAGVASLSLRRPLAILLVALAVSSLGLAAGTQIETRFTTEDYIAEDAPDWTQELPEPLAPSEYEIRDTQQYLYANFQSPDQQVHVLVEGNVTNPGALDAVAAAERDAADRSVTFTRPTGDPAVTGPVGAMQTLARTNDSFAAQFARADTDGDGVPDHNVSELFDSFAETAPARADRLLHSTDGDYDSLQIAVTVNGTADASTIASEMRAVGDVAAADETTVTVAGRPIVNELTQRQLTSVTAQGLVVTLVTVFVVLLVAFRHKQSSASLGAVTLVPVVLGISWILGAMYLVGVPFSFATAIIGSIAIGLGVDYAIHMSERYGHELDRHENVEMALEESVVGTGGALLSSAVTTAAGFGVLAFALVPTLQQFGLLIALTLVFAFVASVLVLPSLLVLWGRHLHTP